MDVKSGDVLGDPKDGTCQPILSANGCATILYLTAHSQGCFQSQRFVTVKDKTVTLSFLRSPGFTLFIILSYLLQVRDKKAGEKKNIYSCYIKGGKREFMPVICSV